jgi:hypothetical protein
MSPASIPEGPGFVSGAPNLPAGFTDTFASRYIDTVKITFHDPGAEAYVFTFG